MPPLRSRTGWAANTAVPPSFSARPHRFPARAAQLERALRSRAHPTEFAYISFRAGQTGYLLGTRGGGGNLTGQQSLQRRHPRQFRLQRLDLATLLLHLIQQHRSELVVLQCLHLAVFTPDYQVRIYLGYFFGDQAVIERLRSIGVGLLVTEGDRPQPQQGRGGIAQ